MNTEKNICEKYILFFLFDCENKNMYYWEALEWFSSISKWLHTWWAIVCVCVCVCSLAQLPGLADWLPLWLCLCWSNVRAQLTIIDVSFNEILYRHFVWCARAVVLPRQDCDDGKQTLVCWIGWCWIGWCWSAPTWKSSGCLCFVWSHEQVWVWNSISFYNV